MVAKIRVERRGLSLCRPWARCGHRVIGRVGELGQVRLAAAGDRVRVGRDDRIPLRAVELDGPEPFKLMMDAKLALARSTQVAGPVGIAEGRDEVSRPMPAEGRVHRHGEPLPRLAAAHEHDRVAPRQDHDRVEYPPQQCAVVDIAARTARRSAARIELHLLQLPHHRAASCRSCSTLAPRGRAGLVAGQDASRRRDPCREPLVARADTSRRRKLVSCSRARRLPGAPEQRPCPARGLRSRSVRCAEVAQTPPPAITRVSAIGWEHGLAARYHFLSDFTMTSSRDAVWTALVAVEEWPSWWR